MGQTDSYLDNNLVYMYWCVISARFKFNYGHWWRYIFLKGLVEMNHSVNVEVDILKD